MAKDINKKNNQRAHRTSIGNSSNSRPKNKRSSKKAYVGQGKSR